MYLDGEKTISMYNPPEICEAFANKFEKNHQLTINESSIHDTEVNASMETINGFSDTINFNSENLSAKIASQWELDFINKEIHEPHRNILTCAEELNTIIGNRNNKKSVGRDQMPNFIIKTFDFNIILILSTFFNQILANKYFAKC